MTTRPAATDQLGRDALTERIFRALYQEFDLRTINGTYVVVSKRTPWFAGTSLGENRSPDQRPRPPGPGCFPCRAPGRTPLPRHHPSFGRTEADRLAPATFARQLS